MNGCFRMLLVLIVLAWGMNAALARTWRDTSGTFSVEAELIGFEAGVVRLQRTDGKTISVPLERLSASDRAFVQAQAGEPAAAPPVARGNLLGPILSDVQIHATSLDPPTIEFSAHVDLRKDSGVSELWGTVDLPEGGEVVDIVAGAVFRGMLRMELDGVDFLNPPPHLRLQRGTLEAVAGGPRWNGKLTFPEVKLSTPVTTLFLLTADGEGNKGNLVKFEVDLRTGKVTQPRR